MAKKRQTKFFDPKEMLEKLAKDLQVHDTLPSRKDGDSVPKIIGRYPVLRLLGSGGMGSVYLAFDRQLEREIAIKVVRRDFAQDQISLDRFNREAKIAAAIDHPNIVKVFDWGTDSTHGNFIVLEYVKGETLQAKLKREGPMTASAAIEITEKLAKSLGALSRKHIVHRDIKPGNILLSEMGEVKLTDLGIAKRYLDSPERVLTQGKSPGTPDFMAPEQKNSRDVDVRADIYSLGKTFFFLLTGTSDVDVSALKKTLAQVPFPGDGASIRKNDRLVEKITEVIQKMTELDRSMRYQSAEELLADLRTLKVSRSVPHFRRSQRYLIAGAAVLILLALIITRYSGDDSKNSSETITQPINSDAQDRLEMTMNMIDDISKQVRDRAAGDYWTNSPRVVLVLPLKIESDLPKGLQNSITRNKFSDAIKAHAGLPIVDRDLLPNVLKEYNLEVANLTHANGRLKLRQVLPASILLETTASANDTQFTLNVKVVNVETTEILGFIEENVSLKDAASLDNLIISLALRVAKVIRHNFPIQGKVVSVDGNILEVNLGEYHGVQKGATFQVRKAIETTPGFFKPGKELATGAANQIGKFNAYLSVQEGMGEQVEVGMLVIDE